MFADAGSTPAASTIDLIKSNSYIKIYCSCTIHPTIKKTALKRLSASNRFKTIMFLLSYLNKIIL